MAPFSHNYMCFRIAQEQVKQMKPLKQERACII